MFMLYGRQRRTFAAPPPPRVGCATIVGRAPAAQDDDDDDKPNNRPFANLFSGARPHQFRRRTPRPYGLYNYGHVRPDFDDGFDDDDDDVDAVDGEKGGKQKPAKKPDPSDKGVLRVEKVDFKVTENTKDHHTNEFDIAEDLKNPQLVVRRGQPFLIEVTFNKPYDVNEDDLRLVFSIGDQPLESKGTQIIFILSAKDELDKWGAAIKTQTGNTLLITVFTPSDCLVGKWTLNVDVVKRKDDKVTIFRYNHKDPIYILFNPWCKNDCVFMENERDRQEFVIKDKGKIFAGSYRSISAKPWVFGQFSGKVLDAVMQILDISELKMQVRGNPVNVVRKLTAMINSSDEGGVLVGNWSGDYKGGKSPLSWTGSAPILEQFYTERGSVKFGQCWVFSGVLTTVLRALGIPARSVTNFASAHDTDGSITIDTHYDSQGNELKDSYDSVWNFHVWNEAWMARPDLPAGYGGWQACDATPQEASDNVYCCGPCPLRAIKEGEIHLPYDGAFIFAEVNADKVYWQQQADGTLKPIRKLHNSVGKFISTMGATGDRNDVTCNYKYPEDSPEERVAVKRANQVGSSRKDIYEEGPCDVEFELKNDDTRSFVGDDFVVTLCCKNNSNQARSVSGTIKARTMYYTGVIAKDVGVEEIKNLTLKPGEQRQVAVKVDPKEYEKYLKDGCMMSVSCLAQVSETKQIFVNVDNMRLRKPHLAIKAPPKVRVGEEMEVQISFTNPMPSTLTNCYLEVEGPGLTAVTKYPQGDVHAKSTFMTTIKLKPLRPGDKEIVAIFNSAQLEDINGTFAVTVINK